MPETNRNLSFLKWKCREGWKKLNIPRTQEYFDRAKFELSVIEKMKFEDYFLIIEDFISWAKRQGIPVGPGRGSGAGSLVCYALGITTIDPIRHGLLFERFLNPDRVSMPDLDLDFCVRRRHEVVKYIESKYGTDKVANIITFGKMWSRLAIHDVARALAIENHTEVSDRIAKAIPANAKSISEAVADSPFLQEQMHIYPELFKMADMVTGRPKATSVHAAGVVITPKPITEYFPLFYGPSVKNKYASITQWDMYDMDETGFLKVDVLGLNTLTVMDDAVKLINRTLPDGKKIDLEKIDLEDRQTIKLFDEGRTTGLFQLERKYVQDFCRKMGIVEFEDVVLMNAIIRPGTMDAGTTDQFIARKKGDEPIEYIHPSLSKVLDKTMGIIVFQEDAMKVSQVFAGFTLAEADNLRKAIGKKIPEKMRQVKEQFLDKAVNVMHRDKEESEEVFSYIEVAQRYSFNKSVDKDTLVYIIGKGNTKIYDVKIGDIARTLDYDTGEFVETEVADVIDHGDLPCVEVVFDDGSREVCTINHKFLTELGQVPLGAILHSNLEVYQDGKIKNGDVRGMSTVISEGETIEVSSEELSGVDSFEKEKESGTAGSGETETHKATYDCNVSQGGQKPQCEADKGGHDEKSSAESDSGRLEEHIESLPKDLGETRDNKTAVGSSGKVEDAASKKVPGDNAERAESCKTVQGRTLAGTEFDVPKWIREEYPSQVWREGETSRFCQAWLMGGSGRMLAFWEGVYRKANLSSDGASERCDVDIGGVTQECYAYSHRTGVLERKWQEKNEGRLVLLAGKNDIKPVSGRVSLRRVLSVRNLGIRRMYDLEIRHESHNFCLASGMITSNSHACAYGKITFQSAWLKTHYPTEFMCELLNGELNSANNDKVSLYADEARLMGIEILKPCVMKSGVRCEVVGHKQIRYGLSFIKNITESSAMEIINARGKFNSISELLLQTNFSKLDRRGMESLIHAGALDCFGNSRDELLFRHAMIRDTVDKYRKKQKDKEDGVKIRKDFTIEEVARAEGAPVKAGTDYQVRTIEEILQAEFLEAGAYISQSPFVPFEDEIREKTTTDIADLQDGRAPGTKGQCIAGMVRDYRKHIIAKGKMEGKEMAFVTVTRNHRDMDCIIFPDAFTVYSSELEAGKIYLFLGSFERRKKGNTFIIESIRRLSRI